MTLWPSSEKGPQVEESASQQTVFQQAEAAIAAQVTSTGQATLLQETDLVTPDSADSGPPAPAYRETYGEIRAEKDGLNTSASVTSDGRVDIRINQLNRRLSQILTHASRQQLQGAQDIDEPPPPTYKPPSLGGDGVAGGPLPPPLNVVIQVVGSRGDVQPFVALGKVLRDTYGHRVRLATHSTFQELVEGNGLEFFSIGGDPSKLMAFMVKNPGLVPGFRSIVGGEIGERRKDVAEYIQGCWRSCYQAGNGIEFEDGDARPFVADCIIANPPSFAHIHCAEKLGIPLHIMFTMPYSPTQAFPHPLANIQASNADPQMTNYMSYAMIEVLTWQSLGDIINRFRAKCLALEPVSLTWAPGMLQRLRIPHTYCWSPSLIPKPKDWGSNVTISGFHFLKTSAYTPSLELQSFLDAGSPPVYIGFGSIVLDNPDALTELIFEAVRTTGQRVLLSKGWGGMGAGHVPAGVFMLGNVPHDWLFERVSCVVHHGGAGTTAAGIAAGRPTLIIPFFGDQPFWGAMVARSGAGPHPIPHRQLTASKLADAINFCFQPETLDRANGLASKIAAEGGNDTSAQSFHQFLQADRLRCTLAPSQTAAWRVKRTKIRLSAFAACTLANANLLDFHDLKLFRPQEYETDSGPWDPISGGFVAACAAFGGMANGLFEIPTETFKAAQLPFKNSRQRSQASVSTFANKDETSKSGEGSTLATSSAQSRKSSSERASIGSDSKPDAVHHQPSFKQGSIKSGRTLKQQSYVSGGDRDMLRHRGAHGSKGLGRFAKILFQSPMDISMSMAQGFQNLPKIWGDDTVRSQPRIKDFNTGARAAGKHFGLGLYDGFTGLVTQPWNGARKEGAVGLLKGIGKGIGGVVAKPCAGSMGLVGFTMKGVHKQVQMLMGANVQNYILASRTTQGYEDWMQSSDAEKEDVIERWKLMQKWLKQKRTPDEMMQDFVEAHQKSSMEGRAARRDSEETSSAIQPVGPTTPGFDGESVSSATSASRASQVPLGMVDTPRITRKPLPSEGRSRADQNNVVDHPPLENISLTQDQRQDTTNHQDEIENLRHAMAISEAEAQRHVSEALEYEERIKRATEQSLQRTGSSSSELQSELGLNDEEEEAFERAMANESKAEAPATVAGASSSVQHVQAHDPGHLQGITQAEYEAQQRRQPGEKTAQETMEENIVMEYVKKQSLLEEQHRNKGKGRAAWTGS